MFNPLKMDSAEKQMLLGGIASSLIYWGNEMAQAQVIGYPAELKGQLDPHLPTNGELVASLAPPVALYAIVKFGKKERLRSIADGSVYFGIPNIIERTVAQAAYTEGRAITPARIVAPRTLSKYNASAPAPLARNMSAGLSKYVLTA